MNGKAPGILRIENRGKVFQKVAPRVRDTPAHGAQNGGSNARKTV